MKKNYREYLLVTEELIDKEAEHTGDYNPLHVDEDYAKKTVFKNKIAHATILLGRISKILAMDFPGEGCVLLKQEFSYKNPIYADDVIEICSSIIDEKKKKCIIKHTCVNQKGIIVLEGKSYILYNAVINE